MKINYSPPFFKRAALLSAIILLLSWLSACSEGNGGLYGSGSGAGPDGSGTNHARASVYRLADRDKITPVCRFNIEDERTAKDKVLQLPEACLPNNADHLHVVYLEVNDEYRRDDKFEFSALVSAPQRALDKQPLGEDKFEVGLTQVSEEIVARVQFGYVEKNLSERELVSSLDLLASDLLDYDINADGVLNYDDVLSLQGDKSTTDTVLAPQASIDADSFYRYHTPLIKDSALITHDDIVGVWALVVQDFQYSQEIQAGEDDDPDSSNIGRYREFCHIEHVDDNRYRSSCFFFSSPSVDKAPPIHELELKGNSLRSVDGNINLTLEAGRLSGHASFESELEGVITRFDFNKVHLKRLADTPQKIATVSVSHLHQEHRVNGDFYAEIEAEMIHSGYMHMAVTMTFSQDVANKVQFQRLQIRDLIALHEDLFSTETTAFRLLDGELLVEVNQLYETPFDPAIFNRYITESNALGMPLKFQGEDIYSGSTVTGDIDWLFLSFD